MDGWMDVWNGMGLIDREGDQFESKRGAYIGWYVRTLMMRYFYFLGAL